MVVFRKEYRAQVRWRGAFCFKNMNYHKITIQITLFILVLLFIPISLNATSGACSWHGGVDCSRGWQAEGIVYCNDGWTDSMVKYDFMVKCQENNNDIEDLVWRQKYYDGKIVESIKNYNSINSTFTEYCPPNSTKVYEHASYVNGILNVPFYCECDDEYYNYKTGNVKESGYVCEKSEPYIHLLIYLRWASDESNDSIKNIKRNDALCRSRYINSIVNDNKCICEDGYKWRYDAYTKFVFCAKRDDYNKIVNNKKEADKIDHDKVEQNNNAKNSNSSLTCQANSTKVGSACVCNEGYIMVGANCISHTENCKKYYGQNVYGTKGNDNNSNCYCNSGYDWDSNKKSCIKKVTQDKKTISSPPASVPKKVSCGDGYALSLDKKTCVKIPKNAHVAQNSMDVWLCNSGYREVGDQCILADNPKPNIEEDNAKLTDIQSQDSKNNTILSDNQSVKEQNSQTNDNVKDKNKTNPVKLFFSNLFLKLLSLLSK